jgi:hypothetical protein
VSPSGSSQSAPAGLARDPREVRERAFSALTNLVSHRARCLLSQAGGDAGDLSDLEAEALALYAFAFLWGRLASPGQGAADVREQVQAAGFILGVTGDPGDQASTPAPSDHRPAEWNPAVVQMQTLFAKHAASLLEDLRRPGSPENDPAELLISAAQSFVYFDHVAYGESREKFALRSVIAYQEARRASGTKRGGGDGLECDAWAARWKRVIPLLREEIAAAGADSARPGQVRADLAALRAFYRAAIGGVLPVQAIGPQSALRQMAGQGDWGCSTPESAKAV